MKYLLYVIFLRFLCWGLIYLTTSTCLCNKVSNLSTFRPIVAKFVYMTCYFALFLLINDLFRHQSPHSSYESCIHKIQLPHTYIPVQIISMYTSNSFVNYLHLSIQLSSISSLQLWFPLNHHCRGTSEKLLAHYNSEYRTDCSVAYNSLVLG